MKTIFITITRGALSRNILRTGVLEDLSQAGYKLVIIVPNKILEYFRVEFERENIVVEEVGVRNPSKFRKFFIILFNGLVYTETEHRKMRFGGAYKKSDTAVAYWAKHILFSIISKINFIKKIARWIEFNIFIEKDYDYLFEKYKPDLIFCSSIYSKLDILLIKSAKRFGIKSISMPKSWDTVGRLFFRAPSDKVILNNEFMREWVVKEQLINDNDIYISGFPQFDIYANKKRYFSKDEFCEQTGLDKNKKIILYASEGLWTHWDAVYVDELIKKYKINEKYNLILRPHYSNMGEKLYYVYKDFPNVYIDDKHIRITDMFGDHWDPTENDMDWTAEILNIADVVLTFMSTFVLDSFAFDKPVINIYYDLPNSNHFSSKGPVVPMKELYNCTHYNAVLEEGCVTLAKSGEEVMNAIKLYLQNRDLLKKERQKTINKLVYKLDGNSSQRIVDVITKNIYTINCAI